MPSPQDLKYTKEHEWVRMDDDIGTIGITDYAQDALGDIVLVDLPAIGTIVSYADKFGEIESVKAVSELFAPVTGEVVDINSALEDSPELVNDSPYAEGWMLRVRLSDPSEVEKLLDANQYDEYLATEVE
ncbi:MAG: glycine cleavage system protein GcvH [Dehalococcoidia bacterium]